MGFYRKACKEEKRLISKWYMDPKCEHAKMNLHMFNYKCPPTTWYWLGSRKQTKTYLICQCFQLDK
jgi:hypothetical protein